MMKNLDSIAEDLFNKIRGRFPSVTIGSEDGKVTSVPTEARFFDFEYKDGDRALGKVSISLDEKSIAVMYSDDFVANESDTTRNHWYNFLKELRQFSKKRLLNFDTRNITKSNLDRRDYKFLSKTRAGDDQMNESTMYGTSRSSFQNIGNARLSIKHTQPVDQSNAADRTRHVESIYIESNAGERFKYPYKHLSGARAMARHVSEGGTPYDDFGSHIVNMSEELSKLRKFKTYVGRSSVMAEGLVGYMDAIAERMESIRKTLKGLQRESFYKETFESFEKPVVEEVPSDVAENWIDQLTIRQFNEELKDVFPFVYKVVSEYTKAQELGPEDVVAELDVPMRKHAPYFVTMVQGKPHLKVDATNTVPIQPSSKWTSITPEVERRANTQGFRKDAAEFNGQPIEVLLSGQKAFVSADTYQMLTTSAESAGENIPSAETIELALDELMGQFSEAGKMQGGGDDPCWKGYKMVGHKKKGGKEVPNCVPESDDTIDVKMTPDGGIEKAPEKPKTPLGEFILSYFDREVGEFPKGETAVLTMIEKDYGEQYIEPAKQFIERVYAVTEQFREPEVSPEMERMRELAGLR